MVEFLIQLALASGALANNTIAYLETLPPAPNQSSLTCRDETWAAKHIADIENAGVHIRLLPFIQESLLDARSTEVPLAITVAYRSCALQQQLRAQNCGLGDFNL